MVEDKLHRKSENKLENAFYLADVSCYTQGGPACN